VWKVAREVRGEPVARQGVATGEVLV